MTILGLGHKCDFSPPAGVELIVFVLTAKESPASAASAPAWEKRLCGSTLVFVHRTQTGTPAKKANTKPKGNHPQHSLL